MQQNVNKSVNSENEIILDYEWRVPCAGYTFVERLYDEHGAVLPAGIIENWGAVEWKRLTLKDHPALYRTLLTVAVSDPSKILAFANRFGLLDQRQQVTADPPQRGKKALTVILVAGNPVTFWQEQVRAMHRAVTLWDQSRVKNRVWLTERITWGKGEPGRFGYMPEPEEKHPAVFWFPVPRVSNPHLQAQFTPDNVIFLARYLLQQTINAQLTAQVAPLLLWRRTGRLDLYFSPLSLCGAAWLQLAEDITRNRVLRMCEYCKKQRVVGAPQKRYCSDSCKTMACRAARKSA
jgi:hypothetical protein